MASYPVWTLPSVINVRLRLSIRTDGKITLTVDWQCGKRASKVHSRSTHRTSIGDLGNGLNRLCSTNRVEWCKNYDAKFIPITVIKLYESRDLDSYNTMHYEYECVGRTTNCCYSQPRTRHVQPDCCVVRNLKPPPRKETSLRPQKISLILKSSFRICQR